MKKDESADAESHGETKENRDGLVESNIMDDVSFVESTEDGEAIPSKDVTKKLREELKTCRGEKEEYLTGWQRAKADYINLQKELEHVRVTSSVHAKEKFMKELLPTLDSFDVAFSHKDSWDKLNPEWQKGIENIYNQFLKGLEKSGIKKIDETDVPFDPNIHQSITLVETKEESKDHTVASVLQVGYKIGDPSSPSGQDRVIRPAKVSIYEHRRS